MFVETGSDVILNCVCSKKWPGRIYGPAIPALMDMEEDFLFLYTIGHVLNPKLEKTKYMIVGNFENNECNLKIMKFTGAEDGMYRCQYNSMNKFCRHSYTVAIKSKYIEFF